MNWVKRATQMLTSLSKPGTKPDNKVAASDSALKDPLTDDLAAQPKLEPAAAPVKKDGVKAIVDKAKDAVMDEGGTDVQTHDAFVKTVTQFAGEEVAEAARADLMSEVSSTDKRVGRSFADTVAGTGGAATLAPLVAPMGRRADEEEEEEEDERATPDTGLDGGAESSG